MFIAIESASTWNVLYAFEMSAALSQPMTMDLFIDSSCSHR